MVGVIVRIEVLLMDGRGHPGVHDGVVQGGGAESTVLGHIVGIGRSNMLLSEAVMGATLLDNPLVIHSSLLKGQAAGFSQPWMQPLLSKLLLQQVLLCKLLPAVVATAVGTQAAAAVWSEPGSAPGAGRGCW